MVNGPLPRTVAICLTAAAAVVLPANDAAFAAAKARQTVGSAAFAQILGKLYFVQLRENLRRILVDYGQKRPCRANVAFNAVC
ncbi:MAG TPA: hypothetical protein VL976_10495 [Xanthobacteraceae bacterium]|nr:hypothetical protein [Xanthobacteraceae bacterium]